MLAKKKDGRGRKKILLNWRYAAYKKPVPFTVRARSMDEEPVEYRALPKIGDILLLNEKDIPCYAREHGGRHASECTRRYFAKVADIYPYVITLDTGNGYFVSESISDIRLGLIEYIRLNQMPEDTERISYDERLLSTFVKMFEEMLLE